MDLSSNIDLKKLLALINGKLQSIVTMDDYDSGYKDALEFLKQEISKLI